MVNAARLAFGFSVARWLLVLYVTTAGTSTLPGPRNSNVVVLIVAGFMSSLKVAVMLPLRETPVAPLPGVIEDTVGGVVSVTVVNDQLASAASALPAASLTPAAPPRTVTE